MAIWRMPVRIINPALGGDGFNLWHCRTETEEDRLDSMNDMAGWLLTFYTAIQNVFSTNTQIRFEGGVTQVGDPEPTAHDDVDDWTLAAIGGSTTLPPANCIVVGWRTSLATRSGRGRTFIGPCGADNLEGDGTVTTSRLNQIRAAAEALVDSSSAPGLTAHALGVWSPTDQVLRDFTASNVNDRFAVLRSRRD